MPDTEATFYEINYWWGGGVNQSYTQKPATVLNRWYMYVGVQMQILESSRFISWLDGNKKVHEKNN